MPRPRLTAGAIERVLVRERRRRELASESLRVGWAGISGEAEARAEDMRREEEHATTGENRSSLSCTTGRERKGSRGKNGSRDLSASRALNSVGFAGS